MPKEVGIVRRIDDLGRLCLPKEIRSKLGIETKDAIEVFIGEDAIVLRKADVGFSVSKELTILAEKVSLLKNDSEGSAIVNDINALVKKYQDK